MFTLIDRWTTKHVISPLAVMVARAKGRDNYAFGGRLLVWTSFVTCAIGMLTSIADGEWGTVLCLPFVFLGQLVMGALWVDIGSHEYKYPPSARSFTQGYSRNVLFKAVRTILSGAMIAALAFWVVNIENAKLFDVLVMAQMIAMWIYIYVPTVERERIEPHLYWGQ